MYNVVAARHATVSADAACMPCLKPCKPYTNPTLTLPGRGAHLLGLCHGARLVFLGGLRLLGRAGARGRLALRRARCGGLVLICVHTVLGYEATKTRHLACGMHRSHRAATLQITHSACRA